MPADSALLDQLSISQTKPLFCPFGAPLIAMIFRGNASIQQACCNHWECPVCGQTRAKQEYRRIVFGAQCLSDEGHTLYFWTLTCRGRELALEDAQENYLAWTNVLLTNARQGAKRQGLFWAYSQATERQKRGHPHSHILTTFLPNDAHGTRDDSGHVAYTSSWFTRANKSAGLGNQHRISLVDDAEAVSRYVAKYLFKDTALTHWPSHWRRVRYSQNWPRPPYIPAEVAITLRKPADWHKADRMHVRFVADNDGIFECAKHHMENVIRRQGNLTF